MAAETPVSHSLRVDPDDESDWKAIIAVSLILCVGRTPGLRLSLIPYIATR
jgi:hypothetical protein